jgi:hypothetical protein
MESLRTKLFDRSPLSTGEKGSAPGGIAPNVSAVHALLTID